MRVSVSYPRACRTVDAMAVVAVMSDQPTSENTTSRQLSGSCAAAGSASAGVIARTARMRERVMMGSLFLIVQSINVTWKRQRNRNLPPQVQSCRNSGPSLSEKQR